MSELGFYLAGTMLRGAGFLLILFAVERLLRISLTRPGTRRLWLALLALLVVPFGIFTLPLPPPASPPRSSAAPAMPPARLPAPAPLPQEEPPAVSPAEPAARPAPERAGFHIGPPTAKGLAGFFAAVYIGVTLILLALRLHRLRAWSRRLAACVPVNDPRLKRLFTEACALAGTAPEKVRFLDGSGCLDGPACCGVRRRCILFPVPDRERLSDDEIRMLLVHELGHLRRGDSRLGFLFHFADALYWFNPAYRLLRKRLGRAWEVDCDAEVVRKLGLDAGERRRYARLILDSHLRAGGTAPLPCPGLGGSAQELKQRITELTMNKPFRHRKMILCALLLFVAAAGALTPVLADPLPEIAQKYENWKSSAQKKFQRNPEQMREAPVYNGLLGEALKLAARARSDGDTALAETIGREAPEFQKRLYGNAYPGPDFRNREGDYVPPEVKTGEWNAYFKVNRELMARKEYRKVFERCRWYFHHALEYQPYATGVRLSYALNQWALAGKKYQPALEELRSIREERAAHLLAGKGRTSLPYWNPDGTMRDWNLGAESQEEWNEFFRCSAGDSVMVHEIAAIDHYLGETPRSIELFRELDRKYPEFAAGAWFFIESECIDAGAFDLVNKYIPDLEKRFQGTCQSAREDLENSGVSVENRKHTVEKVMIVALQRFVTVAEARNQPELADRFKQQIGELSKQAEALK
ncbi:MAG: M56 family metallopeptidase [Lentisphaeria bacterium]|nr:M56 family metallopeptidase [Lentisphaeria bacterium]